MKNWLPLRLCDVCGPERPLRDVLGQISGVAKLTVEVRYDRVKEPSVLRGNIMSLLLEHYYRQSVNGGRQRLGTSNGQVSTYSADNVIESHWIRAERPKKGQCTYL